MSGRINRLLEPLAKVGIGPKGSQDIDYHEAYAAMAAILRDECDPVTLGAFLMAMRWKPETAEELAAFIDAMRDLSVLPAVSSPPGREGRAGGPGGIGVNGWPEGLLDCAGNYDGKDRTVNVSVAASIVAAAAGQPILLHGATDIPSKLGITPFDVLNTLGIDAGAGLESARSTLIACGIAYLHQPHFNPGVHALLAHRWAVGKRTFLNSIEPLANPAGVAAHIGGCFHRPFAERLCRALARSRTGIQRAVIVAGIEGMDELYPGRTPVAELKGEEIESYQVTAADLGLPSARIEDLEAAPGRLAEESAELTGRLLATGEPTPYRSAVLLSAALRLYAGGRATTWAAAAALAGEALDSGAAQRRLAAWRRLAPAGDEAA